MNIQEKKYAVKYRESTPTTNAPKEETLGFYNEKSEAIKKCWKLTDDKMNEHLDDLDENLEKLESGERSEDDDQFYRETNTEGDSQLVYYYGNTYEYWVEEVLV